MNDEKRGASSPEDDQLGESLILMGNVSNRVRSGTITMDQGVQKLAKAGIHVSYAKEIIGNLIAPYKSPMERYQEQLESLDAGKAGQD